MDCKDTAEIRASWDPVKEYEVLPALTDAKAIGAFARAAKANNGSSTEWSLRWGEGCSGGVHIPLDWFAEHGDHQLRLVNEYGEVKGQCNREIACSDCKSFKGYCGLDVGHKGECEPTNRY